MKSLFRCYALISLLCYSVVQNAQTPTTSSLPKVMNPVPEDSLAGYNDSEFLSELKTNNVQEPEYTNLLNYTKRLFIINKYQLRPAAASPSSIPVDNPGGPTNSPPPTKGYNSGSTNATPCLNEDFESTPPGSYGSTISGWTIDWVGNNGSTCQTGSGWATGASKFRVRNTPVNSPFPEISSIFVPGLNTVPPSPLGGNNVAQLGDFNPSPPPAGSAFLRTRIRKSFNVTTANQFFQFAFFGAWETSNHGCCSNPSFLVRFYDCSGNLLPCGSFQFEHGSGCANQGANFNVCNLWCHSWQPFNYSKVAYTPNWQSRFVNLSQLVGQCITVEFISSSCTGGQHVGAVFLDCKCSGTQPSGQQLVGGSSQVIPGPSSQTICLGQSATMNVSGASSYKWYRTSPSYQYLGTGSSKVVTPTAYGTYIYSVAGTPGLCSSVASATLKVVVTGPPMMGIGVNPNPVCLGNTVTLTAVAAHPCSWQWLNVASTNSKIVVTPGVNAVYSVTAISNINGCMRTITVSPQVIPKPVVTAVSNPVGICQGGQFTLTASGSPGGPSSYYWNPGAFIGNPYVVNVNNTTSYTVTAVTSAPNCNGTTTVKPIVQPNPTLAITPNAVCPGVTNTLSASGAVNYTCYLGGTNPATITTPVITVNVTSATPYTLCGSVPGVVTCTSCITGIIPVGSIIPLTAPDVTLCTNGGPCVSLNASSNVTPVNYTWQPGNLTGSSVTVCPTSSTQYTVYAGSTNLGTCPNSSVVNVTYTTGNCCPNAPPTLIPLSNMNGTYQNASYILNNSQAITGNVNFLNSEVWITPGVQLTVPTGSVLNLENTHMFACGINMWQGIKIVDGGRITTSNTRLSNSMIEDAEVAIELDGITSNNVVPGQPAIDISRVIFNKNYIGIKISNSDPMMDSLALGITGCVFTSRDLPYTTAPGTISWPSSSQAINSNGLRVVIFPTTGIVPPYDLTPFNLANLKLPHNNQTGHIGIKIENIGDPTGFMTTPGVQFGITYLSPINPDFNLFDGLGNGIDVTDASLTTANNVFQNSQQFLLPPSFSSLFGGNGIRHQITGIRNARLKLTSLKNTSDGNQFWDCHRGVQVSNVFETWITNSLFRSTHTNLPPFPTFLLGITPGDIGVEYTTNRFDLKVHESEFNNLRKGIVFSTPLTPQLYDMNGSGAQPGVFAQGFNVEHNYFGSQVFSNVPLTTEYMSDAIDIQTPLTSGWQNNTGASYIASNKFNRIYRGVHIDGMADHQIFVGGNEFLIHDDYIYGAPDKGWGVKVENNLDNMAIVNNTVQGQGTMPTNSVSLVLCENNFGTMSPLVSCNLVLDANYGFEFSGLNPSTVWRENEMCNHFAGLALTNNGVIGPQGGMWAGNGNLWRNTCTWANGTNWQTYCENSNPVGSELYVFSPSTVFEPTIHGFFPTPPAYSNGPTVIPVNTNTYSDCMVFSPYGAPPSWRTAPTGTSPHKEDMMNTMIEIFPNPTKASVTVRMASPKTKFKVVVRDVNGKLISEHANVYQNEVEVDLSELPAAVYFFEMQSEGNNPVHRKVIKVD